MITTTEMDTDFMKGLKSLFDPASIAVVGASRRPEAVGHAILENLIKGGYTGALYAVNPKGGEILGHSCCPAIDDLPGTVDLAVIIVPAPAVPEAIRQCARKGIHSAIVISAGFRETGPEGKRLEEEVMREAAAGGIAVLGPNCLGLINTDPAFSMNASFSRTMPKAGNIAFISQSGALCTAALDYAKGSNIGFSKFISFGNKAVLNEIDILRYLGNDDQTDVILMYLEDLVEGRQFIETAREITGERARTKPILVIKAGRTAEGARAAASHTGSLMGADEVYDAIFAQAGVLRMESVEDMFDLAIAFGKQPLPKGNRTAIITNAGGPGIMATDACVRYGLRMAELSRKTVAELKEVLPPTASFKNPVDVIGDARHERYEDALRITAADPNVDGIIVILTPQAMTAIEKTAQVIINAEKQIDIPLIACFMGITDVSTGVKMLEDSAVPHYRFPEGASHALAAMYRYHEWISRPRTVEKEFKDIDRGAAESVISKALKEKQSFLTIEQSMAVFEAYGFPVIPYGFGKSPEEAAGLASKIGFPAALKIVSRKIIHKFDIGGVRLNLRSADEVLEACREMQRAVEKHHKASEIDGYFVQMMAGKGREVILGMNRHPRFGPTLMFGLGGVYVEALKDVTFRLAPIRVRGAELMISSIRAHTLLEGIRGEAPSDRAAIAECLERLSQLACEQTAIREIDINPLIAHPDGEGASVVDGRIILDVDEGA